MVIPEGDWFCPICEHTLLIEKLQEQLDDYDQKAKENVRLMQRKQRLAFVTVNITNVIEDADRRAALKIQDRDLYDDEGSEEEEEQKSAKRKSNRERRNNCRQRNRRRWNSSESSSYSSSAEDEAEEFEELSENEKKKPAFDFSSDTEESWSVTRRSRRQRKQISYKFEEYEEMMSGAIEDDVKVTENVAPRRSGKDMSNITGICESPTDEEPPAGKRKKRSRQLTRLDTDDSESEDDSEEFQLSEEEEISSADEDDAADNGDEDLSDDWSVARGSSWKKPTRTSQRPRRPTRFNDFVDDDSEEDDDPYRCRGRRTAAQRRVNYHEISESDSAASDSPRKAMPSGRRKNNSSRLKDSDSEYQPSSDADENNIRATSASAHVNAGRHKRLGSSSDEGGLEAVSKKKGRLNRILSSSDTDSADSDDSGPAVRARTVENATSASDIRQELPVVNGKDSGMATCNAASENNKGFTIANLLKGSVPSKASKSCSDGESVEGAEIGEEDSLSGIEDLVSYVTQT
jgi:remodeling and spacing factor 1